MVRCPDGHLSKDILSKDTTLDSNSEVDRVGDSTEYDVQEGELHVTVEFDNGDDPELMTA